ncbi:SMR family transporter [Campylobacter armoricus]
MRYFFIFFNRLFYVLKKIDLSIAYAIWGGCGITLINIVDF